MPLLLFHSIRFIFPTTLFFLLSGCVSTLPVTQGPLNLNKGQFDPHFSIAGHLTNYDSWNGMGDEGHSELFTGLVGMNYGLSNFLNVGANYWLGLAGETGIGPQLSIQLLKGTQKLNLCLKGGVAWPYSYPEALLSLIGIPELIWGPCEYFFVGFRYSYRWYKENIDKFNDRYDVSKVYVEDYKWSFQTSGVFISSDYSPVFMKTQPFLMYNYNFDSSVWQITIGFSYHFMGYQNDKK